MTASHASCDSTSRIERAFHRMPWIDRASETPLSWSHTRKRWTISPSPHAGWSSSAAAIRARNRASSPDTTTTGRHTSDGGSSASSASDIDAASLREVASARSM